MGDGKGVDDLSLVRVEGRTFLYRPNPQGPQSPRSTMQKVDSSILPLSVIAVLTESEGLLGGKEFYIELVVETGLLCWAQCTLPDH